MFVRKLKDDQLNFIQCWE